MAALGVSKEEKVIAEFHGVRLKKQRGVLLITSVRVAWAPGEMLQTFQANYLFQDIKAQRVSAEMSSKVQLQLILHSGVHVNFHFTATNAGEQRQQAKTYLAQQLAQCVRISPELEAKNSLLKSNQELYQLYKDLVTTSIISADEFWANQSRVKLLSDQTSSTNSLSTQESGLPSAFLADVQAVYDGCNAVRYNLSTDAMQAIFKTYPAVKRKHAECVPDKLSEQEFWTGFFQSQLLHQPDRRGIFTDTMSEDTLQAGLATAAGYGLNSTETSSTILGEEGYGSEHSSISATLGTGTAPLLLQRCNHHSNRILHVLQEDTTLSTSSTGSPSPSTQHTQHLSLPHHQSLSSTSTHSHSLLPLAHSLSTWHLQQGVDSCAAQSALSHLAPGCVIMSGVCRQVGSSLLTQQQQQELLRHQAAMAELLRHFWACFPTRTAQLETKAHRLHQCLVDYSEKQLAELHAVLDNSDSLRVVEHMNNCLSQASQHYNKWISKKKAQTRGHKI